MIGLPGLGLDLLAPLGLAALIGVPLVVVFHMRHTAPVTRDVPTLRFWLAAHPEQTERTSFRRPPVSLLLLLHLLIAALLALALTRPTTTRALTDLGLRTEPRHLILLLDGSTSMAATDTPSGRTRFEEARALALQRLGDLRAGDVATVVVMGTHSTTLQATDTAGFKQLRSRVAGLAAPGGRVDLNAALRLTEDLLLPRLDDRVVLISDGALAADPGLVGRLGAPIELVRVGGDATGNVAITELAARASPGNPSQQQLYVRIANFSAAPVTAPVTLTVDKIETARKDVTLPAGGAADEIWPLPAGASAVSVKVNGGDALPADDTASLILHQTSGLALKILLVSDAPEPYLQRALAVYPGAQVDVERSDSPAAKDAPADDDLVVYENYAPAVEDLPKAPLLFVHPPENGGPFPTRGPMSNPSVVSVRARDPLLNGVDLSGVTFAQTPAYVRDASQTEVVGAAEGPLIFRADLRGHQAVVLAFDIGQSNIRQRVAFPILIANVVNELAPSPLPAAVPLGDPLLYRPRGGTATLRITPPLGPIVNLPIGDAAAPAATSGSDGNAVNADAGGQNALRQVSFADTGQPGVYGVTELDASGTELGGGRFVVNAGHATESDLRPNPTLPSVLATAHAREERAGGAQLADLWPILVVAALALLMLEWLVTTRRQTSTVSYQPSSAGR